MLKNLDYSTKLSYLYEKFVEYNMMEKLTQQEEEVMLYIWELGDSRAGQEGQREQAGKGGGQEQSKLV